MESTLKYRLDINIENLSRLRKELALWLRLQTLTQDTDRLQHHQHLIFQSYHSDDNAKRQINDQLKKKDEEMVKISLEIMQLQDEMFVYLDNPSSQPVVPPTEEVEPWREEDGLAPVPTLTIEGEIGKIEDAIQRMEQGIAEIEGQLAALLG